MLVDGYNVLRSGSRYRDMRNPGPNPDYDTDSFNRAREALIDDVVMYAGRDFEAIIVFDGADNEFSDGSFEKIAGVRIMFSRAGDSADKVIEKLAWDARARGIETMVVSSDAAIQNTVFGGGVDRMSANGFSRAVAVNAHEFHLDESPKTAVKNTVAERLGGDTVAKLKVLRDSLEWANKRCFWPFAWREELPRVALLLSFVHCGSTKRASRHFLFEVPFAGENAPLRSARAFATIKLTNPLRRRRCGGA